MKLLTISLLVLSLLAIGAHAQTDADAAKINLGTADKFALLGASGIIVSLRYFSSDFPLCFNRCAITGAVPCRHSPSRSLMRTRHDSAADPRHRISQRTVSRTSRRHPKICEIMFP